MPMRFKFKLPPDFSYAPLIALIPGLMMLAGFGAGGVIAMHEIVISGAVLAAGAVWAGLKQTRSFPETVTRVDTALASTILDALPDPVVLLDGRRRVLAANRAADELIGEGMHGRDACLILRHPEAQGAITTVTNGTQPKAGAEIVFEAPVRRIYQLQVMGVPAGEGLTVRAVAALHEITALKRAESMRADFVANVSHELRSPLSSLTGFIETLSSTAKDDPQAQERFLGIMEGEAGRMTRLIDDLLSLSRIEVNEHIRPRDRVDLRAILDGVRDSVEHKAAKKNVSIVMELPAALPDVVGSADELREVFQNLVENAVKYGAANSAVTLAARPVETMGETGGAGIEVAVTDQGEGIAPEHLPRLTERFYRVDKGRSRSLGGTGLGLAIVKHILNRHRGRMLIDSEIGQGSTFRVQLPVFTGE